MHISGKRLRLVSRNVLALLPPRIPRDLIRFRSIPFGQSSILPLSMDVRCCDMSILREIRLSLVVESRNWRVLTFEG